MLIEAFLAVAALAAVQDGDTTFAARSADFLDVEMGTGVVVVRGWDRSDVRIRTSVDLRHFDIDLQGDRVDIEPEFSLLLGGGATIEIDVPARFGVSVEGLDVEVHVEDLDGWVDIESLSGDVTVLHPRAEVQVETMAGSILVEDATGDLDLTTAGFGVEVIGATGDVEIETIGGPVDLVDIDSPMVEAASLGGRISFEGALHSNGTYHFESHGGLIDLILAPGADATFEFDTNSGNVSFDYPGAELVSDRRRDKRYVVGRGTAEVEIETFSGGVRVRQRSRR